MTTCHSRRIHGETFLGFSPRAVYTTVRKRPLRKKQAEICRKTFFLEVGILMLLVVWNAPTFNFETQPGPASLLLTGAIHKCPKLDSTAVACSTCVWGFQRILLRRRFRLHGFLLSVHVIPCIAHSRRTVSFIRARFWLAGAYIFFRFVCAGRGHSASYHFAEPAQEKLPKGAKPGDLFTGEGRLFGGFGSGFLSV